MKKVKRCAALLLCAAVLLAAAGCSIFPTPGFAEYDVSGYVKALLDSSYHGDHDAIKEISGVDDAGAQANSDTTVENAAIYFCNNYGISPSDRQLDELKAIMRQAFALTKYTVKEERKVEGGYYLEVEVAAITNFEGRSADIDRLKIEAQDATIGSSANTASSEGGDDGEDPASSAPQAGTDANTLFVDKVLEFCKSELANISYDPDTRSLPLDVIQTEKGELQLDMNQLDAIDRAVIRF